MLESISNLFRRAAEEEILIRGFGKLTRSSIQRKMKSYMKDFVEAAKTPEDISSLKMIRYILTNGVLKALIDVEIEQLQKEK